MLEAKLTNVPIFAVQGSHEGRIKKLQVAAVLTANSCNHLANNSITPDIPRTSQWATTCLQCFNAVGWAAGRASGL